MPELSSQEIEEIFQSLQAPFAPLAPLPYLSSIYKMGNAIIKAQDLAQVKSRLKPLQIQHLWHTIISLDATRFSLDPNKRVIEAFQYWMTHDIELLAHIGCDALMKLGQDNENEARKVLIIFIRTHSHNQEAFIGFNYHSLIQGTAEQTNESSVWPAIKKCSHLPKMLIKQLGKNSSKIAKNILLDIQPHPDAKEIESFFQQHHNWPKPIIEKSAVAIASSASSLSSALKTSENTSSFLKAYMTLLDVLAVLSSGLFYLFRASITRAIPIAPYAAAPILTLYGLYRLKNYYDESHQSEIKPFRPMSSQRG